MVRYFIRLSYIGTKYRGSQINAGYENETIQGVLEKALQSLRPLNEPRVVFASRTDKGVHALMNTVHIDLTHRKQNEVFQPHFLTERVNFYFKENNHDILVTKSSIVPDAFHARKHVKWRSYIYRLAIPKLKFRLPNRECCDEYLPITEVNRCHIVHANLDMQKMQDVAKLYCGQHDFTTFTKNLLREPWRSPLRYIDECKFYPTQNIVSLMDPNLCHITMWEFYVKSKSFLYHQIRKLFGAALAVGLGDLDLRDVETMLENPSPEAFGKLHLAPPCGLYLAHIQYDKEDFIFKDVQETPQEHRVELQEAVKI